MFDMGPSLPGLLCHGRRMNQTPSNLERARQPLLRVRRIEETKCTRYDELLEKEPFLHSAPAGAARMPGGRGRGPVGGPDRFQRAGPAHPTAGSQHRTAPRQQTRLLHLWVNNRHLPCWIGGVIPARPRGSRVRVTSGSAGNRTRAECLSHQRRCHAWAGRTPVAFVMQQPGAEDLWRGSQRQSDRQPATVTTASGPAAFPEFGAHGAFGPRRPPQIKSACRPAGPRGGKALDSFF